MNKQTKRLLILLISVLSLFGLFGCRANPTENGKDESDSTVHDYREGYTNDTNNLDVTPQEKGKEPEEPSTVRLLLCWDASSGTVTQEGLDRVADALAKQAEPLGLILEVLWAEEKDVLSRLSAALESGETLDLCYLPAGFFQSRDQGLLLPIARNDLQENAPAFNARMGRTAAATSAGNMVYGFPAFIRRGAVKLMSFRADLCEAAGYSRQDIYSMTAWSEIEALMRKAQAVAGDAFVGMAVTEPPTTVGLGLVGKGSICAADRFAETTTYEDLGDPLNLLGVTRDEYPSTATQKNIACIWNGAVGNCQEPVRRLYFWNIYGWIKTDEGLIRYGGDPDEIFASVHIFEVVPETGVPYGWTDPDRYWVELTPAAAGTADFDKSIFVIPVTAQAPMGALRVLDLLYSSDSAETLADLLFTGGSTNGEPDRSNYQNAVFSSSLFLPETAADLPGWRQSLAEQTRTRALGRYLGFHPDTSADRELMNRLRRAALECIPPMTWGQIEYSKSNRSLLNIAGLEKYIDYYLQQLNDWLDQ